ncbi:MAG: hypothetical protein KGS61_09535, partial [Verrucomicrobia bacterium]|nr:hypothetical protein [Verrucomicrobiota bacterium]
GDNRGTFNVASNAVCSFNASYTFEDGSLFSGAGPSLLSSGVATFNGGAGAGNLQWIAAQLAGTLSLSNGSTLYIASGNDHNMPGATFNNHGTVIRTGGRVRGGSGAVISNEGSWVEQVDNVFNNDYGGAASTFVNYGTYMKTGGSGATSFLGGQDFSNRGTVDVESGVVSFTAGYAQTNGTLRFGASSLTNYGQVSFPGNVGLEGTVALALLNGYLPTNGSVLAPVNYGSRTGTFGNAVLPPLASGSAWQVSYASGAVLLRVVGTEPTDTLKLSGSVTDAQGHPIPGVAVQAIVDPASATNLIQNGSFEVPTNGPSNYLLYAVGSTNIPDWLVVGPADANIAIHGGFLGPAEDGVQYFDPTGVTGGGGILQTFPTVLGQSYELIFFHGTANQHGIANVLGVTLATNTFSFGETDGGGGNLRWTEVDLPFTASSNLTTVTFRDLTGGNSDDNFVDNVQVLPADSGRVLSTVTDANGNYQIAVVNGTWQVSVNGLRSLGYNDVTNQTVALNNANAQVNFVTTPFAGQTYTVTTAVVPTSAGSVTGAGTYAGGSSVTVSVAATNAPYLFVNWTENGFVQSTSPTYTFTLSRDRQLVANFILPAYQVSASNNPPGAGSVAGTGSYFYGTTNVLLATPAFGYSFASWTADGVLLGTNPSLTLVVYSNEVLVAGYAPANLQHTVTTASLPAGLATVSGAGVYTNGQTGQFNAPASITNGPSIYTFSRFTLNGAQVGSSPTYSKTFATTDPTNLTLVAEYTGQSIAPVVIGATANLVNPVGATTNFVLTLRFDRTMNRSVQPVIVLSNTAVGGAVPAVPTGGVWSASSVTDDTYATPPITVVHGMDGYSQVWVSQAQDLGGRTLALTNVLTVQIDATPPVISSVGASPGLVTAVITWITDKQSSSEVDFGVSTNYELGSVLSRELVTLHSVTRSGLGANTRYHYRVRSQDLAGNSSSSGDQTFTTALDVTPPQTQIVSGPQNGQRVCALPVTFAWSGADDATPTSQLVYAYQLDGQSLTSFGPATTVTYTNLTPGPHVFLVKARDLAGNIETSPPTLPFSYDPARPVISGVTAAATQSRAVVSWATDKPATSALEYGLSSAYGTVTPLDGRMVTNHIYIVTALTPNTTYHYRVHSQDSCGDDSESADATFITAPAPDLQVVALRVLPSTNLLSGATVTLRWTDTNSGAGPTTGPWYDQVVVSNLTSGAQLMDAPVLYDSDARGNVTSGDSRTNEYSFRLPDGAAGVGSLAIWVTTDFYNNQQEQNASGTGESNNTAMATATATLAAYPDLVVSNLVLNPAGLQSGLTVTLSWQDVNTGQGSVNGSFTDRVVVFNLTTGDTLADSTLPYDASAAGSGPIAGGQAVPRQTTFRLPDGLAGVGAIELDVTTDSGQTIPEFSGTGLAETNNTATVRISSGLAPYPDLAVGNIVVPATGVSGQPVQVLWTDSNLGTAPATGPWVDQVYLADDAAGDNPQLVAAFPFPGVLGPNQTLVRTQAVVLPAFGAGGRWVVVRADSADAVFELNKANNLAVSAQPITVPPALTLNLSSAVVPESARNPALTLTVTRNTDTGTPLTVAVGSSNTNKVVVPPLVVLAAGQASVSFPANVIDDGVIDGDQVVALIATAPGFGPVTNSVTVIEADVPALALQIPVSTIRENAGPGAAVGYLSRNTATNLPLVVSLASSDTRRLSLPATVTIPAGARSSSFDLTPIVDNVPGSTVQVNVNATATGLQGASVAVTILDSDVPMLQVSLAETNVSGGAINPATVGTVTRSPVTAYPVTVILQTSDPTTATVPATVTLAANQASATFPVSVVPSDVVTGTRIVQINAFPSDNTFNTQVDQGAGAVTLAVTDDKQPTLQVAIAATIVGRNGATTGTVSRNTQPTNELVVALSSSDPSQAQVPNTITIPTGQAAATFAISSLTNIPAGGLSPVTITASASGYNFGQRSFNVSDIQLPDLLVSSINAAPGAVSGATIPVTWTVRNNGIASASGPWLDRLFISSS